jgi:hypothetical protein
MALKISYCQLIKIVLAQIGGSPLQQVYTQLSQGMKQISTRGIIPSEIAQIKAFIDQVTTTLNGISGDVNAMQQMANQFFYNPVGTVTTQTITQINLRLAQITEDLGAGPVATSGNATEFAYLNSLKTEMTNFKTHSDRLSGQADPEDGKPFGGCTLADLLGDGCSPAGDVPDIDLQVLVDGFKSGAIIEGAKSALTQAVLANTGGAALISALGNLQSTVNTFNTTVTTKINKLAIKRAVESYVNYVVFNLLTGCSNTLLNATLIPSVKEAITPYAQYIQKQQLDAALDGATGQPFTNTTLAT